CTPPATTRAWIPTGSPSPVRCARPGAACALERGTAPFHFAGALISAIREICAGLLPRRRLRAAARVVRRKMSNYGVKRAEHRAWPHPHLIIVEAIRILAPP
ncbi:MAG: hypothetical protein WCH74_14210, partial [Chloroflexota bacterium]